MPRGALHSGANILRRRIADEAGDVFVAVPKEHICCYFWRPRRFPGEA